MRKYLDLQEHLAVLERKGLLFRVKRQINKDTEMHPLVRWQYRGGIPEEGRKAFLFENIIGSDGKKYDIPVVVGALAASSQIYALGLQCEIEEITERWLYALNHPIDPVIIKMGACQEVVYTGDELDKGGKGLDLLPVPISTPGFDNAPYTTCSQWYTKDPETGIRNAGNYRGQIKGRRRMGMYPGPGGQHIYQHWLKCKERGIPLEAALVIGGPPAASYTTVEKVPYGVDELAVAGGLTREPIEVVRCKTINIEVPAQAEIVLEGRISTEYLEPEGPFGESHGYMHPRELSPFFEATAITMKKKPIFVSYISQVTPSESSVLKKHGYEALFLRHLRDQVGIKSVIKVGMHEPLINLRKLVVVQFRKPKQTEVWRALYSAVSYNPGVGKVVIAVDEDLDVHDADALWWAVCYRTNAIKDVKVLEGLDKWHTPPFESISITEKKTGFHEGGQEDSFILINATLKAPFPPVSLPAREYMEHAKKIWEELGLPKLKPQAPWFGYSLGQWNEELEEEAHLATEGRYYETGEKLSARRVRIRD